MLAERSEGTLARRVSASFVWGARDRWASAMSAKRTDLESGREARDRSRCGDVPSLRRKVPKAKPDIRAKPFPMGT